ncbi:MAG TPA: polysaccharide deacetylase family protein [Opitutaceae bacterium]|nr:polysaccharide deacetylase family protein [Opitutaceae bacterium]HRJ47192.1 polysaccharide deacetylase family protein [Opitutaceae bacterium]
MAQRPLAHGPIFRLTLALVGCALFGGLVWLLAATFGPVRRDPHNPPIHRFEGVSGPAAATVVPPAIPADWRDYDQGGPSRLVILLTDEDSNWAGLAHGLKSIGVPFRITRDANEAGHHRVMMVYPSISGRVLTPEALRIIARHPETGGTVIGCGIEGGGLEEVFGIGPAESSREHRKLRLDPAHPLLAEFTDPLELELPVNSADPDSALTMLSHRPTRGRVLASYEDGRAALVHRAVGSGHAYALGPDVGHLLLKGYNDRQELLSRSYANGFEPALDTWLRLLRAIYREGEPAAVTLHTVPGGRPLSVVLTHDIDFTRSIVNAPAYAALEREQGVAATYFIQTKYVQDWNDDIFMNEQAGPILQELLAAGAEIASHSVSHSRVFENFPPGTGTERYPTYRPFVQERLLTVNGTVLGELRVSKFLLERLTPGLEVQSFRPGHLRNPRDLPQLLQATGYRYSSSTTANNAMTHLPFRLMHGRATQAVTDIYEFPVTIEDELPPPLPQRLGRALHVAERIARYGGLFVVLIHTDSTGEKLEFQRRLTAELQAKDAWFGRLQDFAAWWVGRDQVELDAHRTADGLHITLKAPLPVAALALQLPGTGWRVDAGEAGLNADGSQVRLNLPPGTHHLRLHR